MLTLDPANRFTADKCLESKFFSLNIPEKIAFTPPTLENIQKKKTSSKLVHFKNRNEDSDLETSSLCTLDDLTDSINKIL